MAKELDKKQKKSVSGGKSKGSSGGEGDPCRTGFPIHQSVKPSTEKNEKTDLEAIDTPAFGLIAYLIGKSVNKNKVNHN